MEEQIVTSETVETPIAEQAVTTENAEPSTDTVETKPEKTFTQAEVDELVKKRLDRDRESTTKKAAQAARDAYIAEQGYTWNGKPVTTEAEYKQAVQEQDMMAKYRDQGLPDEVVRELVEGKNFREQYQETQKQLEQRQKKESDYQAFVEAYPDVKGDDIPQTVWDAVNAGKSLVDAYAVHENALLKQKLAEVTKSREIEQQNAGNAASSTGSVTGNNGDGSETFFTREQVHEMERTNPGLIKKNYDAIVKSMKKW